MRSSTHTPKRRGWRPLWSLCYAVWAATTAVSAQSSSYYDDGYYGSGDDNDYQDYQDFAQGDAGYDDHLYHDYAARQQEKMGSGGGGGG